MKNLILLLITFLSFSTYTFSQGVGVISVDSATNSVKTLLLKKSSTTIKVESQVAITKTSQEFKNTGETTYGFKYAFPMPESAAAYRIRWNYLDTWYTSSLISVPQDTTFISDSTGSTPFVPTSLDTFLGETPLYFPLEFDFLPEYTVTIELTYVELLPYQRNVVSINYPGGYDRIQTEIDSVDFAVDISSHRGIEKLTIGSYKMAVSSINDKTASVRLDLQKNPFSAPFSIDYLLEPDTAGFFGLSTYFPDSLLVCDSTNGFFTLIIEPNSSEQTEVIDKDFVIIVDHSGSMGGTKMSQANEAASFIVNNLNTSDRFNIVRFNDKISSASPSLMNYTASSKVKALEFIAGTSAGGSTNISGSFAAAVPMFRNGSDHRAKIIIFLTDGHASSGITKSDLLLTHINDLINATDSQISVNVFGIGTSVNFKLLSEIALQNNGVSSFLTTDEVAASISDLYVKIQNPVLLNTAISFEPKIVSEVYPVRLPNLYRGEQLILNGRYNNPGVVNVKLTGTAFGKTETYNYTLDLSDSLVPNNNFLPKVWTKSKLEYLMSE